jgi:glutamine synthetase
VSGGDGYSEAWHKMAVEERGLPNLRTTADALPVLKEKYIEDLFERLGILSPVELESRFDVYAIDLQSRHKRIQSVRDTS